MEIYKLHAAKLKWISSFIIANTIGLEDSGAIKLTENKASS